MSCLNNAFLVIPLIGFVLLFLFVNPLIPISSDILNSVDVNSFDQNTTVIAVVLKSPTSNITMVDLPADRNEFAGLSGTTQPSARFQLDLNRVYQYRLNVFMGGTTASTTSMLLQHSDNNTTFYDSNIGNETNCCVLLAGGIGMKSSGWIDINQSAAGINKYFRLVTTNGNNVNDVSFRNIEVQFKVPVSSFQSTSSSSATDTNCSNNTNCVITGRINSSFDANVSDINSVGDSNFTGNNASIPPITVNSLSSTIMQRWMLSGLTELEVCNVFGFSGFCSNPTNNPVAFFGFSNLTGYFSVSGSGLGSALNDDVGWEFQAPLTQVTGALFKADNNANVKDLNVSNNSYVQRETIKTDLNVLQNATISNNLYVDKNIITDHLDRDLGIALDTCYQNAGRMEMHVYGDIKSDISAGGDTAYIDISTGNSCGTLGIIQTVGVTSETTDAKYTLAFNFDFLVPDNNYYKLTSNAAGMGTVTLDFARGYYP